VQKSAAESKENTAPSAPAAKAKGKFAAAAADAAEFEVSSAPEWDPEAGTQPGKKT
jgi:hypothetical protein